MTATRDAAVICQAVSVLLGYPDQATLDRLPIVSDAARTLPPDTARAGLERLVAHLAAASPRELAERYVATFDRRRRCCLYLSWWHDGETRRRGESLAALKSRYRSGGLELASGELPDFLPVMLEYAATGDLADGLALLQEHRAGLELLRLALRDLDSPYAGAVEAVCTLLPGPSRRIERQLFDSPVPVRRQSRSVSSCTQPCGLGS